MAIQISGCTVIDNNRNIKAGIGTFDFVDVPPSASTFSPADGATNVSVITNISITFSQQLSKGSGNITLRDGGPTGTILETIDVNSASVTISGAEVTINPSITLPPSTDVYVVIPEGAFLGFYIGTDNLPVTTYNFTTIAFAFVSITPSNGATNQSISTNITLSFTSPPVRGTGTIELRRDSVGGTLVESFDAASSGRISVSGNDWILDPTNPIEYGKTFYLIIPNTAISNYAGLNVAGGSSHSFTTESLALGCPYEGGYFIYQSGSTVRWVVSPIAAERSTSWYSNSNAVTAAQQVSGCSGWFVPTVGALQFPGYSCRTYWDQYSNAPYWTNSPAPSGSAYCSAVSFVNGGIERGYKPQIRCARAFRCVTGF